MTRLQEHSLPQKGQEQALNAARVSAAGIGRQHGRSRQAEQQGRRSMGMRVVEGQASIAAGGGRQWGQVIVSQSRTCFAH